MESKRRGHFCKYVLYYVASKLYLKHVRLEEIIPYGSGTTRLRPTMPCSALLDATATSCCACMRVQGIWWIPKSSAQYVCGRTDWGSIGQEDCHGEAFLSHEGTRRNFAAAWKKGRPKRPIAAARGATSSDVLQVYFEKNNQESEKPWRASVNVQKKVWNMTDFNRPWQTVDEEALKLTELCMWNMSLGV